MIRNYGLSNNIVEAYKHLDAFWNRSSLGRPALSITVKNPEYQEQKEPALDLPLQERELQPQWQSWIAERMMHRTLSLAEALPKAYPLVGSNLATFTSLLDIGYVYKSGTAWIDHHTGVFSDPLPTFQPDHPFVQQICACMDAMHQVACGQGYLSPPVFMDGLTALSLLRGNAQLCMDLLEIPDVVARWRDAATQLYIQAYEHFYQKLRSLGYGDTCTWYAVTAPGRFEAVQCDFAVFISPKMFRTFVMPDLEQVTAYLDYSLYHLDGTCQVRFFNELAALPHLNGIQWNPEPGAYDPRPWIETMKEIRRRGWCLYIAQDVCSSVEIAAYLTSELGPDGLFLELPAFQTAAEAEMAIKRITNAVR